MESKQDTSNKNKLELWGTGLHMINREPSTDSSTGPSNSSFASLIGWESIASGDVQDDARPSTFTVDLNSEPYMSLVDSVVKLYESIKCDRDG